jgi:uncharacterized protein
VARAVLDAGVLVSAAIAPNGVCGRLLRAATERQYTLIASPQLIGELQDVLRRPKFRPYVTVDEAMTFVRAVSRVAELASDPPLQPGLTPDPDDDYLVALARAAHADFLISGDPDLTTLENPEPPVVTPSEFLSRLG